MFSVVWKSDFNVGHCPFSKKRSKKKIKEKIKEQNGQRAHVKMRSPNQGLGSIPVSKKWGFGSDPRVRNM